MEKAMVSITGLTVLSVQAMKATDFESVKTFEDGKRTNDDMLVDGEPVYRLPSQSFPVLQNG